MAVGNIVRIIPHKNFRFKFGVRGENGKTQRTVNPSIAGSSPVDRPTFLIKDIYMKYISTLSSTG